MITTKKYFKKKAHLGYSEALTVEVKGDNNTHCFYSSAKRHKQYVLHFTTTILQLCCHGDRTVLTYKLMQVLLLNSSHSCSSILYQLIFNASASHSNLNLFAISLFL